MSAIDQLLDPVALPKLAPVRQRFDRPRLVDVEGEISRLMAAGGYLSTMKKGGSVAITAGSRGIVNMPVILRALVREVRKAGCEPFVFPAMGSHGGATAEGQAELLQGMGIDEKSVEAPIRSSMETVRIGETEGGLPVYMDAYADKADALIVVNRVKPHVAYSGAYESGLMKMLAIGVGKQLGADFCHRMGFGRMAENVPAIAKMTIARKNVVCAVAVLENAFHETARIEFMRGTDIERREPELLREASLLTPRLFFDQLDVRILDEIGKDIAGTGFDTSVVGRYHTPFRTGGPQITRILTLDLTEASHGNANGVGILDFTTRRLYEKFSPEHTYPNSLTSTVPQSVKMPMALKNDRQAIQAAVKTCNVEDRDAVRLVRVKNTVELENIWVSESLTSYCERHPNLELLGPAAPFAFDGDGNLL
ncbi:MAG: DUF362 domain-containing protein [Deltaproteobacteria bacterium]|jgi:hypothetical protein|nr:DUF362 domain-containing protein [Deltaproteobacteria bacterium]